MDVDSIAPGLDFVRVLEDQVDKCDVFLAVVGPRWLIAQNERGEPRLNDPNDFVRIEIESGLKLDKRIIPVLVNNATMPSADQLPTSMQPFARRNAIRLTHERFNADADGLINAIKNVLVEAEQARAALTDAERRAAEIAVREARQKARREAWSSLRSGFGLGSRSSASISTQDNAEAQSLLHSQEEIEAGTINGTGPPNQNADAMAGAQAGEPPSKWRKRVLVASVVAVLGAVAFFGWQEIENARLEKEAAEQRAEEVRRAAEEEAKAREAAEAERQRTAARETDADRKHGEAKVHYDQGKTYSVKKDYDRAIAQFTKAIALDPTFVEAYRRRGDIYEDKKDYDLAIADYTKAIELDPKHVRTYGDRGISYNYKGEKDRAIADFTKAIALDPKEHMHYLIRGQLYLDKEDYDSAIADYTKLIELDRESGEKDATSYNIRAEVYEKAGRIERAIADYRKALEIEPLNQNAKAGLKRLGAR